MLMETECNPQPIIQALQQVLLRNVVMVLIVSVKTDAAPAPVMAE
jgi:hypothetical protein